MEDDRETRLRRGAKVMRACHALIGLVELASLGYVWVCAVTRRRDRVLRVAVAALYAEGCALVIGRGNCPLGPFQARCGDPVPLFELVLPRRAAKAAVPVLSVVTVAGIAALVGRSPSRRAPAEGPPLGLRYVVIGSGAG